MSPKPYLHWSLRNRLLRIGLPGIVAITAGPGISPQKTTLDIFFHIVRHDVQVSMYLGFIPDIGLTEKELPVIFDRLRNNQILWFSSKKSEQEENNISNTPNNLIYRFIVCYLKSDI